MNANWRRLLLNLSAERNLLRSNTAYRGARAILEFLLVLQIGGTGVLLWTVLQPASLLTQPSLSLPAGITIGVIVAAAASVIVLEFLFVLLLYFIAQAVFDLADSNLAQSSTEASAPAGGPAPSSAPAAAAHAT